MGKKNVNGDYFKLYGEIRRDSSNRIAYALREKERALAKEEAKRQKEAQKEAEKEDSEQAA
jgi:hypothetical protein